MKPDLAKKVAVPTLEELMPGLMENVASPSLSPRPPIPQEDLPPPVVVPEVEEVVEAAMDAANGRCQGSKGDGTSCPRRARPGKIYCGAHMRREVLT